MSSETEPWPPLLAVLLCALLSATAAGETTMPDTTATDVPSIDGHWDGLLVTTSTSRLPILGEVRSVQRSRLDIDVAQRGADLQLRIETCSIDIETSSRMVSLTIPQAFVDSIAAVERPAQIETDDGQHLLVVPRIWEVQGVELDDPEADRLPESADDERVFDQDGDGHPGVTVAVSGIIGGEVYVVQKGWNMWRGAIGDGRIRGALRWHQEQSVLDASSRWLRSDTETRPTRDIQDNYFVMQRRDTGSEGC